MSISGYHHEFKDDLESLKSAFNILETAGLMNSQSCHFGKLLERAIGGEEIDSLTIESDLRGDREFIWSYIEDSRISEDEKKTLRSQRNALTEAVEMSVTKTRI